MKRRASSLKNFSSFFVFLPLLSACSPSPAPGSKGEAYFQALNCRSCHRIGADGGLGGPDLTYVGFRHSKEWLDLWLRNPQAWKPGTIMPNPNLTDGPREALVDYLSSLQGQAFAGAKPWDAPELKGSPVERGRVIFARAGCIACHGKGGAGGFPNNNVKGDAIPALAKVYETYTKEELKRKITNGVVPEKVDPSGPEPLVRMPPWGQKLSPAEIDSVADYLLSFKAGAKDDSGF